MFVSQAHSFKRQATVAVMLAWVAGYTNILTLLACYTVTSHVSGTVSNLGRDVIYGDWGLAAFASYIVGAFFIGAMASGMATEIGRRRGWESIFVLPIVVETIMLGLVAVTLAITGTALQPYSVALYWIVGLAAAAMGLQNATITQISSGHVRTTHMTGVLTDLGHETTLFLYWLWDRRRNVPPFPARGLVISALTHPTGRRLTLLGSILASFIVGACLGTLFFRLFRGGAMFPPVGFLMILIYLDFSRPIGEIEASSGAGAGALNLPAALAVYHLRRDHDRVGRVHRMPNLLAWADRLSPATRIVILDIHEVRQFDDNAALELRALFERFAELERHLIIAGINREQLQQLNIEGMDDVLNLDNVCPDLELAIARGLNRLDPAAMATEAGSLGM